MAYDSLMKNGLPNTYLQTRIKTISIIEKLSNDDNYNDTESNILNLMIKNNPRILYNIFFIDEFRLHFISEDTLKEIDTYITSVVDCLPTS